MGDSRDESLDSRYWGFADREDIIGMATLIYWSHDTAPQHLQQPGVSLRHMRGIAASAISKTRWERTPRRIR